jgi:hypothetical protein
LYLVGWIGSEELKVTGSIRKKLVRFFKARLKLLKDLWEPQQEPWAVAAHQEEEMRAVAQRVRAGPVAVQGRMELQLL